MKTRQIITPIIESPKSDLIYELPSRTVPGGKIIVTFEGEALQQVSSVKISCWGIKIKTKSEEYIVSLERYNNDGTNDSRYLATDETVPTETLPLVAVGCFPPFMLINKTNFVIVSKLQINVGTDTIQFSYSLNIVRGVVKLINDSLKQECQAIIKDIPVEAGQHPIYAPQNRPDFDFLNNLYQQFWQYNQNRISDQYKLSYSYCHIRAHFISIVLHNYGIDTVKIFKMWNLKDWLTFTKDKKLIKLYDFHCGLMIVDKDNNKWVWDPWVGNNNKLLTLAQWVYAKNAPKPISVLIANRSVLCDYRNGEINYPNYNYYVPEPYRNILQALIASAVPHLPARSITFFKIPKLTGRETDERNQRGSTRIARKHSISALRRIKIHKHALLPFTKP